LLKNYVINRVKAVGFFKESIQRLEMEIVKIETFATGSEDGQYTTLYELKAYQDKGNSATMTIDLPIMIRNYDTIWDTEGFTESGERFGTNESWSSVEDIIYFVVSFIYQLAWSDDPDFRKFIESTFKFIPEDKVSSVKKLSRKAKIIKKLKRLGLI
jgi:hypothetical protein